MRDAILAERSGKVSSSESLVIEQTLNKLFYEKQNIEEELRFLEMIMRRNGASQERWGLHGSAIISSEKDFCYREQVLSLFYKMSQGENIKVDLKRIFEEGNAIHEKWQRLFIRGGLGVAENMDVSRFDKRYDLSYTPDIDKARIGKHDYVVEIKSVNTYQFGKMKSHPSGKKQLMLYMYLTGIHKGFVLCEDKNTQQIKVFVYDYDEEEVLPFIERLEAIQIYKKQLVRDKKMVPRIPECTSSSCKRANKCNMRDACWNVGNGRIRLKK